jgi:hypothetical protein
MSFLQSRCFWFVFGLLLLPIIQLTHSYWLDPTAKQAIPFSSLLEESRQEFFFPADYSYTLRSKGSKEEFLRFVKKMKMEQFRGSELHYEKKDGSRTIKIFYEDNWITYSEDAI